MAADEGKNPTDIIKEKLNNLFGLRDSQQKKRSSLPPKAHFSIWYFVIVFLLITLVQNYFLAPRVETLTYSAFKQNVAEKQLGKIAIGPQTITGIIKGKEGQKEREFMTVRVEDPALVKDLEDNKIDYSGVYQSAFLNNLLSWVIPILIFFLIWRVAMKRMGPGMGVMSFSKSKAKLFAEDETKITFADVAGIDEAKEELQEVVEFLEEPGQIPETRGPDSQRGPPGRPSGDGQDPPGQGRGRRGAGSFLQHQRLRICGNVRRRRRRAGARPVLPGDQPRALHHFHR